jgi:hypothetical protein
MIIINQYRFPVAGGSIGGTYVVFGTGSGTGTFAETFAGSHIYGTGGPIHATGTVSLANGANGRYVADYLAANNKDVVIGLDQSSSNTPDYGGYDVGVFAYSGTNLYAVINAGSLVSATVSMTPTANDVYCINRQGTVYTAEIYRGGSWTVIHTFTGYTSTVEHFRKVDLQGTGIYITNARYL